MPDSTDDIELLGWDELVRRRPEMFIGRGQSALGWLVFALLDCPREPRSGVVTLNNGVLDIWVEAQPVSVAVRKSGSLIYLIEVCSHLTLPLDDPPSLNGFESLDGFRSPTVFRRTSQAPTAMALANAVSRRFVVKTAATGRLVHATFSAGKLLDGPREEPTACSDGVGYLFDPEPRLFQGASFSFGWLARTMREFSAVRGVGLTLRDAKNEQTMIFSGIKQS